jgi:UDP-N-acetylglucosamine 2-epimerase (non-hydrolysing)
MIDSLARHRERALTNAPWRAFGLDPGAYGVVTLHRPSNVDDAAQLDRVAAALAKLAREMKLVFPVHPRTLARAGERFSSIANLITCDPLGYLEFLGLMAKARVVVTDSGGIQEETTALGVQCLTVRENTERPITMSEGTNQLVPVDGDAMLAAIHAGPRMGARIPALWDGNAAVRIVDIIEKEWTHG